MVETWQGNSAIRDCSCCGTDQKIVFTFHIVLKLRNEVTSFFRCKINVCVHLTKLTAVGCLRYRIVYVNFKPLQEIMQVGLRRKCVYFPHILTAE